MNVLPLSGTPPQPSGAIAATGAWWLVCRAGRRLVALPVERIAEVMRILPVERIAGAPTYVRGLSIVRGGPVPVVDLGLMLDGAAGDAKRLVTVKAADRLVALAVDDVVGLMDFTGQTLGRLPPLLHDIGTEAIAAIGARDAELIVFLQASRLVPGDVLTMLAEKGVAS